MRLIICWGILIYNRNTVRDNKMYRIQRNRNNINEKIIHNKKNIIKNYFTKMPDGNRYHLGDIIMFALNRLIHKLFIVSLFWCFFLLRLFLFLPIIFRFFIFYIIWIFISIQKFAQKFRKVDFFWIYLHFMMITFGYI